MVGRSGKCCKRYLHIYERTVAQPAGESVSLDTSVARRVEHTIKQKVNHGHRVTTRAE
jgi:hypothetical protein